MKPMRIIPSAFWLLAIVVVPVIMAGRSHVVITEDDVLWTTLSDGSKFPLVGLGVGNLQHDLIADQITTAVQTDKKMFLFDTAHASDNEAVVRDGIVKGLEAYYPDDKTKQIHVVTKVWYTHLGYERTKLSVKASLENLNHPNIKVHILIHWPRCNDEIPWMNCEQEELNLPEEVKNAGPAPHLFKDTAFLESWKALEDIYLGKVNLGSGLQHKVASIGVSNFALEDFKALEQNNQRVTPMILQGNIWSFLFDPHMMDFIGERKIHFQAYNVIHGVFYGGREFEDAPNAILALNDVSRQLSGNEDDDGKFPLPSLVLKWLVQNGVSVIPRTSSVERLSGNSALNIARMPDLDNLQADSVRSAVAALLSMEDLKPPMAQFVNRATKESYHVYWVHADTGEEVLVKENLGPGERYDAFTQKNHKFVAYSSDDKKIRKEWVVHAQHGQQQRFDIREDEEL